MGQLNVAVMSSPRQPSYLDRTLRSLFVAEQSEKLQVRVVVDGPTDGYVGKWRNHPRVTVECLSEAETVARAGFHLPRRIGETCYRCLRGGLGADLVLCQDDVEFAPTWLQATLDGAREAERRLANRHRGGVPMSADYAIALYATQKLRPNERPLAAYKPANFFGNQGLFLPRQVMA